MSDERNSRSDHPRPDGPDGPDGPAGAQRPRIASPARLRPLLAGALAVVVLTPALLSCERGDVLEPGSGEDGAVTSVPPSPSSVTVSEEARTDSTVLYGASWDESDGATSYSWSAGSDSDGWSESGSDLASPGTSFSAPRDTSDTGSFFCVRAVNSAGESDQACTDFTVPAEPSGSGSGVASVEVAPDSSEVEVGATVSYEATIRDSAGDELGVSATWTSSDNAVATVDGGLVTGQAEGTARIRARADGVADTALVAVTPADTGTSGLVTECASPESAWIWCDDFEEDRLSSYFEHNEADGSFVRTDGVGVEGSSAMRAHFDQGQVSAGWLHLAMGQTPDSYMDPVDDGTRKYREIYWRMYVRYEDAWTGGGGYKMSRAWILATSDWDKAMMAHVWSGGTDHEHLVIDPASGTDEAGNLGSTRWLGLEASDTPVFAPENIGQWHCVEARVRLNEAGQSDGVFRLWIDGQLEAERTGLNWVGSYDEYGINVVKISNYWNGGSPAAQERYIDNFVVSTERIGC